MIKSLVSTTLTVYAILFIVLSHASLIACKFSKDENQELKLQKLKVVGMENLRDRIP